MKCNVLNMGKLVDTLKIRTALFNMCLEVFFFFFCILHAIFGMLISYYFISCATCTAFPSSHIVLEFQVLILELLLGEKR